MIYISNLLNLDAEAGADLIGDDSTPAVTFKNISTGPGMQSEGPATAPGGVFKQHVVGNMSIGVLRVHGNSVASGAVLEFQTKGFASITSVVFTTVANTDYAIRVQVGLETRWIPCFKDAAIIGAAAF